MENKLLQLKANSENIDINNEKMKNEKLIEEYHFKV